MHGLDVARVLFVFSFFFQEEEYQCALIHWFSHVDSEPDENIGIWVVEPEFEADEPHVTVVHINSIYCATHLMPIYRTNQYISRSLAMHDTLDTLNNSMSTNL